MHAPFATIHTGHHQTGARGIHLCRALAVCDNNYNAWHTDEVKTLGICIAEIIENGLLFRRCSLDILNIVDRVK